MYLKIGNLTNVFNDGFWVPQKSKTLAYNIPLLKKKRRQSVSFNRQSDGEAFVGTHLFLVDAQRLIVYIEDIQNG